MTRIGFRTISKRVLVAFTLGAISMLSMVGCGGEQAPTPTPSPDGTSGAAGQSEAQQVTITAKDDAFDPKSYTVEAGKPIKLTVVNAGQNIHEVEVVDILPETKLAPGQSRTIDIDPQKPGTHKLYCEIHEDSGMEGEFTVK